MSNEAEYAIENGWLVEVVNEHTCGTGPSGYYGAHEPGCGMVPLARVEDLLRAQAAVERVRALVYPVAAADWAKVVRFALDGPTNPDPETAAPAEQGARE